MYSNINFSIIEDINYLDIFSLKLYFTTTVIDIVNNIIIKAFFTADIRIKRPIITNKIISNIMAFSKKFFLKVSSFIFLLIAYLPADSFLPSFSINMAINKSGYRYYNKNFTIKLSTILTKSIITIYKKFFIKIADLAYFS